MAFELSNSGALDVAFAKAVKTTAAATAVGDLMGRAAGATGVTRATSSDTNLTLEGIAQSIQVAADTEVLLMPLLPGMRLIADLANNSDAAHNGDRMALTDHDTLNNSGTDVTTNTGVFRQIAPYGAAADKKAIVEVVGAVPTSVTA